MQLYTNHAFCCLGFTYYSYRQKNQKSGEGLVGAGSRAFPHGQIKKTENLCASLRVWVYPSSSPPCVSPPVLVLSSVGSVSPSSLAVAHPRVAPLMASLTSCDGR